MSSYLPTVNAFVEDTCVLVVLAYALVRGHLLLLLSARSRPWRHTLYLGALFGLIGSTEIIIPSARSPYVLHTLIITFATLIGGYSIGLIAVATVCGADLLWAPQTVPSVALALCLSVVVGELVKRTFPKHIRAAAFAGGAGTQAGLALLSLTTPETALQFVPHTLASVAANGIGVLLLQIVIEEARTRANSERHRIEAEQARTAAVQAQLAALRARMQPHFLFNALTSIAALCRVSPAKAETGVLRLSQIMRRALVINNTEAVTLADEMEFVRGYLEIEQYRMGERLTVVWTLDPAAEVVRLPAFTVETLVENAVVHGLAPKIEAGTIRVITRWRPQDTLVIIADTGVGMTSAKRLEAQTGEADGRAHGLQIASQQLALLYGPTARIRLFTHPDKGTIAAFALPNVHEPNDKAVL